MAIAVKEMAKIICTMYFGSAYSNMHDSIYRNLEKILLDDLSYFPAVVILGPRQCGKSTLARHILQILKNGWLKAQNFMSVITDCSIPY